ncbi:MAG TPA: T9SS type A sorting domain-containing protein [Bacteroidota bacterium]|nr:T9SS type A sorting domain-containing protein [Bacteroidota bacterium]
MKKIVIALLFIAAAFSVSLYAQTVVPVTSDAVTGTEGNLNNQINAVITADPTGAQLSNTVFQLAAGGYYVLTSTITTPAHSHLTLVGPDPGTTFETSLPQIVWTNSGGVTTTFNFDCGGDLTMKNIWILCAKTSGAQVGTSIVLEDDSLANLSGKGEHLVMDGCNIDYQSIGNGGGAIEPSCRHLRAQITNTYFRNCTDPHYRYYGRPLSFTYQSTTWHIDTVNFENCTFANCGYDYMQESPEYGDHVSFNHCTFVNTMMFTLESSYWWWLSVTNCLFVNSYMFGDIPSGDGANHFGAGGLVNIDSVKSFGFTVPFSDSTTVSSALQRHILISNNSYGHEKWYTDYLTNNPYLPSGDTDKIHRMPAMSSKTLKFFTGTTNNQKNFPYMTLANLYPSVDTIADWPCTYNAATDPGFIQNPCNEDSIKAFLLGRWYNGTDHSWAYNPSADVAQSWPLAEDLSYTNPTLKAAAMGGFPLGDLFHWWGPTSTVDKYTSWLAQAPAERASILNQLTNGPTSVNGRGSNVPSKYELNQNYPNPFNPSTVIKFSLPVQSNVRLELLNILGQVVKVVAAGTYSAGSHEVTLNASSLASGVYFYKLQTENFSSVKKMLLLK